MTLVKSKISGGLMPSVLSDFFEPGKLLNTGWFENEFNRWMPAVNIRENGKQFNIELAAPGFSKSDFKVNIEGDILTISAEKKEEKDEKDSRYTRREFTYSSFSRSFTLPQTADAGKMDAKYEDGVLKFVLPKKEEAKTSSRKEIKVS